MVTSSNGNLSAILTLCEGNQPVTGGFPSQRPVTQSFDLFFDLHLNKILANVGYLRRHRARYDITVMTPVVFSNGLRRLWDRWPLFHPACRRVWRMCRHTQHFWQKCRTEDGLGKSWKKLQEETSFGSWNRRSRCGTSGIQRQNYS